MIKKIADLLKEHPFFQELSPEQLEFIAGCGKNVVFKEQETIAKPGDAADLFYLITHGEAALILDRAPSKPFIFQTLGRQEILGLSWLIPPYRWTVRAQAVETLRAIAFDGACIRKKCESDHDLGFKLMKRLAELFAHREQATWLHLHDIYGSR
jgi:CRP/FNR family cyclic AMP-dependent transcriptional regulator